MADAVASSEGSDVARLAALVNRVLGEDKISLSPPIQMLCDAMIEGSSRLFAGREYSGDYRICQQCVFKTVGYER